MKSKIKLVLGVIFAGAAVMAVSQSVGPATHTKIRKLNPCYSVTEVQVLMKSNLWSENEAKKILELACKFSGRNK